ncbi:hypothetical protein FBD94_17835 [Pedobacter hiemivivus]|uniref:Beta-lactamase-inhibitor-like PepSY-like domain-containing protein n=1 Tax=Pedobacter hiemivivus TaxID=2530454 RepID=A0A4U1G7D9_9SPHI|nr:hypothetical protein [Pedobacter hiemivivus]TCC84025.1 hypothetical protein EZ444_25750 [Pedobacter hiemivivus]TKC58483.1 hypothetical protein FBD94_17835 [Pedobacter hiemivivus]
MKKQMFFLLLCGLVSLLGMNSTSAQIKLSEVTILGTASRTVVTNAVSKSFNELFKDAIAPQWYEVNKRYVVNFIMNDQKNRAVFTKGGSLVYHLVYAAENEIPEDVKSIVKDKYPDYKITFSVQVEQGDAKVWFINVEDATKILILKVYNDEMTVVNTIKKA